MAHDKFRDAVAAMSPQQRAEFDKITKRKGDTPEQCVSHLVSYPADTQKYYDAAGVKMPDQEALDATVSMAESSRRSAQAAEQQAFFSKRTLFWTIIGVMVTIAALVWAMLTAG